MNYQEQLSKQLDSIIDAQNTGGIIQQSDKDKVMNLICKAAAAEIKERETKTYYDPGYFHKCGASEGYRYVRYEEMDNMHLLNAFGCLYKFNAIETKTDFYIVQVAFILEIRRRWGEIKFLGSTVNHYCIETRYLSSLVHKEQRYWALIGFLKGHLQGARCY